MADLFVRIGANMTEFSTAMQNMERKMKRVGKNMQKTPAWSGTYPVQTLTMSFRLTM